VANDSRLTSSIQLQDVVWEVQGYKFYSNLKVIPLQHYDLILGYDWLEKFSPMKVHWGAKWMSIPYGTDTVILQGLLSSLQPGAIVQVYQLTEADLNLDTYDSAQAPAVPKEIQQLLQEFVDVFAAKAAFPPPRSCNHSIPLITRARPIQVRPYRYAPLLKDEIEHQVTDMLEAGLIQHILSPFSSPVILVKKKDG
jgi:hypothetical protein